MKNFLAIALSCLAIATLAAQQDQTVTAMRHRASAASLSFGYEDYFTPNGSCTPGSVITTASLTSGTDAIPQFSWALSPTTPTGYDCYASQGGLGGSVQVGNTVYPSSTATQSLQFPANLSGTIAKQSISEGSLVNYSNVYWTDGIPNNSTAGDFDNVVLETNTTSYCTSQPFGPTGGAGVYIRIEDGPASAQTNIHSDTGSIPNNGEIPVSFGHRYLIAAKCDLNPTVGTVTTSNGAIGSCPSDCIQWTGSTYGLSAPFNMGWPGAAITINGTNYTGGTVYSTSIMALTTAPGTQTNVSASGPGLAQVALLDPSNNYAQVGSTIQLGLFPGARGTQWAQNFYGNNESGTASSSDYSYFEDEMTCTLIGACSFPDYPQAQTVSFATPASTFLQETNCSYGATCSPTTQPTLAAGQGIIVFGGVKTTGNTLTLTGSGTGCPSSFTAITGAALSGDAATVKAWIGLPAAGTGTCNLTMGMSPDYNGYVSWFVYSPISSGAVDATANNADCAACTSLSLTSSATTSVNNELALVFWFNSGGSYYPQAQGFEGINSTSGETAAYSLAVIPNSGTSVVWNGVWANSATDSSALMVTIKP